MMCFEKRNEHEYKILRRFSVDRVDRQSLGMIPCNRCKQLGLHALELKRLNRKATNRFPAGLPLPSC